MQTQGNTYQTAQKTTTVRFRRYCRKAYAVFSSLGKNVTIGTLATYIADKAIAANNTNYSVISFANNYEKEESEIFNIEDVSLLNENINIIATLASVHTAAAAACTYAKRNNIFLSYKN